jgi:hypothetical protein
VMWKSSYISQIWSRYFFCIRDLALHILHWSSGYSTWLTTMFLISIWNFVSYWTKRSVSYSGRNSGMRTAMNVVLDYVRLCLHCFSFASWLRGRTIEGFAFWWTFFIGPCRALLLNRKDPTFRP